MARKGTAEIQPTESLYPSLSITELGSIDSYAAAEAAFDNDFVSFSVGGDYDLVDKSDLVGVEFIVLRWRFTVPKEGQPRYSTENNPEGEFVSVECITHENRKVVFNDGSTGVYAQLKAVSETGRNQGGKCVKGLRVSEYEYESTDARGKVIMKPAKTYYLT